MAAKRRIEIFYEIHNETEFERVLRHNRNTLICAEIFSCFAGHCTALDRLFTTIKLDWSDGKIILLKVPADEIETLERFRNQSEPVYMFILRNKVTKVFRGVSNLKLAEVAKKELMFWQKECDADGVPLDRPLYELNEPTPDEMDWIIKRAEEKAKESSSRAAKISNRQACRKRHRAEMMVAHLQSLNFVLFWPHSLHAHPDLYERWDANNIIMVGRELIYLTEEQARDVLYAGDAPLNEASLQKLLEGEVLAICFRLLDTDRHFVSLVRKILYEDLPEYDESKPSEQPRVTAFELYKSFSPTRQEVWQKRREDNVKRRAEEIKNRARRLSEMQRMARQAIEDAKEAKKLDKENRKMGLLKAGNLQELKKLEQEPDEEEIDIEIPEKLPDEMVEESSSDEDENEYMPPPGLPIPGFYAPPNDVAKANGLAVLFPKIVADYVTPEPEFLPPHVLVMLDISKRYKVIKAMANHSSAILHMGMFKVRNPSHSEQIAYSVRQFDTLDISTNSEDVILAMMVSVKSDLALLQLMDFNPIHVSRDPEAGEDECAAMFPLGYGDEYDEFEDFHSL